ncbi:MAG: SprB repeat-containing protein [Bacteroidetes bacterium]|nr:SprB repeat-containing protein [Bacteroidota bacterium]
MQHLLQPFSDISATQLCGQNNGSITTSVSGGTPTYTYLWNTGATTSSITNVAAGTYTVTVTDSKLCTKSFSQTISNLAGPVVTVDSVKNVSCFGGNNGGIYISVTGNSPFTYAWSNGAVSQDLVNVAAGTYTVTVTDNSNCQAVVSRTITQPTVIAATLTQPMQHVDKTMAVSQLQFQVVLQLIPIYGIRVLQLLQLPMWLQVLTLLPLPILNFVPNLSVRLFQIYQALL